MVDLQIFTCWKSFSLGKKKKKRCCGKKRCYENVNCQERKQGKGEREKLRRDISQESF